MTGDITPSVERQRGAASDLTKLWFRFAADFLRQGTARVEPAARRRRYRAGHVTLQQGQLLSPVHNQHWDRSEQGLCIRMQGLLKQLFARPQFNQFAQVHHTDAVADVLDYVQVV
jgi:hypothetical protein